MDNHKIYEPYKMGSIELKNHFVMAPLTRNRSDDEGVATDLMAEYYAQRAEAGLIISEATNISKVAYGYALTPGIFTQDQCESWKKVTKKVHENKGKIFCQLWHCGRVSHSDLQPNNQKPVSASAVKADAEAFTPDGKKDAETPKALTIEEIKSTISDYKRAAELSKEAGFDGIEIHAANGYLLHQFMSTNVNRRDDEYGGSVENRMRFTLEVVKACKEVWDAGQIGIRLAPVSPFNDVSTEDPAMDYEYICKKLSDEGLAYIHLIHGQTIKGRDYQKEKVDYKKLKEAFSGSYISNNCLTIDLAKDLIDKNEIDLACFGRKFLANPDLVTRFKKGAKLNEPNQDTFYGGGKEGYTDYSFLND